MQTCEEGLVFMGHHIQSLVMEVIGLRTSTPAAVVLEVTVGPEEGGYCVLVDQLFSATAAIKQKFEDYK